MTPEEQAVIEAAREEVARMLEQFPFASQRDLPSQNLVETVIELNKAQFKKDYDVLFTCAKLVADIDIRLNPKPSCFLELKGVVEELEGKH